MRLAIALPPAWDVEQAADGNVVATLPSATGEAPPDLVLTYGPLIVKPDEPRLWAEQAARADVPRGAMVKLGRAADRMTNDGWAMRLVEADITLDSTLIEVRVCVLYTFMEHGCAVTIRASRREQLEARFGELVEILAGARPDWRAQPLCLADAWDLERPRVEARDPIARAARPDFFEQELARLSAIEAPTADDHVLRGVTLLALDKPEDALAAARSSLAIGPSERAHYLAGTALGALGRPRDAIVEWHAASALGSRADTHYNLGVAYYTLGDFDSALASFRAARSLDAADVLLDRKIIQCLYALGRIDDGAAARASFRRALAASRDPRIRVEIEYVFDQTEGNGFRVHVLEPLRQRDQMLVPLMTFRAVDDKDRPLGVEVLVETSEYAKQAGTPYVIGAKARGEFRVAATLTTLPPYAELRAQAIDLLAQLLTTSTS